MYLLIYLCIYIFIYLYIYIFIYLFLYSFLNIKDASSEENTMDYAWNPCTKFNLGTGCENALVSL